MSKFNFGTRLLAAGQQFTDVPHGLFGSSDITASRDASAVIASDNFGNLTFWRKTGDDPVTFTVESTFPEQSGVASFFLKMSNDGKKVINDRNDGSARYYEYDTEWTAGQLFDATFFGYDEGDSFNVRNISGDGSIAIFVVSRSSVDNLEIYQNIDGTWSLIQTIPIAGNWTSYPTISDFSNDGSVFVAWNYVAGNAYNISVQVWKGALGALEHIKTIEAIDDLNVKTNTSEMNMLSADGNTVCVLVADSDKGFYVDDGLDPIETIRAYVYEESGLGTPTQIDLDLYTQPGMRLSLDGESFLCMVGTTDRDGTPIRFDRYSSPWTDAPAQFSKDPAASYIAMVQLSSDGSYAIYASDPDGVGKDDGYIAEFPAVVK